MDEMDEMDDKTLSYINRAGRLARWSSFLLPCLAGCLWLVDYRWPSRHIDVDWISWVLVLIGMAWFWSIKPLYLYFYRRQERRRTADA